MTAHGHRFLFARSVCSDSASNIVSGHFDLALVAASWDQRAEAITTAGDLSIETCILLCFTTKDEFGYQARHEATLRKFLHHRARKVSDIKGDATMLDDLWPKLWQEATKVADRCSRPLRVLIDISTCPRYYSLGLIAGLLKFGFARSVTVFYAEGIYKSDSVGQLLDVPFTVGQWNATAIPFLNGMPDALKRKAYVVSVGFEGIKTARVLAREDPDRVSILFPDPGSQPQYVEETWNRNAEQYRIPTEEIVRAPAGDAVAAWKALTKANIERVESESVYYLCGGTKAHSLGLALRGLCVESSTVMYNLPARHTFVGVEPSGVYWTYKINDVTCPAD